MTWEFIVILLTAIIIIEFVFFSILYHRDMLEAHKSIKKLKNEITRLHDDRVNSLENISYVIEHLEKERDALADQIEGDEGSDQGLMGHL